MLTKNFDIIIAGAGLSGLTLALELARRPFFQGQKILLIDRDTKEKNDRTWCFWATDEEVLPPVIHKTWNYCRFFGPKSEIPMSIAPYKYHMVRGIDFYRWAAAELSGHPNFTRLTAQIKSIDAETGCVSTDQGNFISDLIFNSALTTLPLLPDASELYQHPPLSIQQEKIQDKNAYTWMLQHFKGWIIETPEPVFDPETVTFMDYRIEQHGDTRFVYVLPLSPNRALVEFTVFSPALCQKEEYDKSLRHYITTQLNIHDFKIVEEEFGVIPMTDYPLPSSTTGKIQHMGTVGGFVKASSGYAFKRTQQKIRAFVEDWENNGVPNLAAVRSPRAFRIFDSIMLRVLNDRLFPGHLFFQRLFQRLEAPVVFRFLDEDATFAEIIRLLRTQPTVPFLKAALRQMPVFRSL